MSLVSDIKKIKKHSEQQGLVWQACANAGHFKIRNTKDKTKPIVIIGATIHNTGDTRLIDNIIRQLKQCGYDPNWQPSKPPKKPINIHLASESEPEPIRHDPREDLPPLNENEGDQYAAEVEKEIVNEAPAMAISTLNNMTQMIDQTLDLLVKMQAEYERLKGIEEKWNKMIGIFSTYGKN